ncbi:MAG TPA: magnesium transporter CorA family protein [Acidimicrobiales bacterium]
MPPPGAPGGRAPQTRLYRGGTLAKEGFPVEEISDHLSDEPDSVVWLDLCAPTETQLSVLQTEFGLHDLAIEDALHEGQRTKLDRYQTHLFLSAHSADVDPVSMRMVTREIAVFITKRSLITVRKDPGFDIEAVVARWERSDDLARNGVGFLLYGLLDYLVDSHFRAVEALDDAVERTEDKLFEPGRHAVNAVQRESFELRKSLVVLRRVALPMREVLNTLLRQDLSVVPEAMEPYYRDVYDHVIRASEWTESLRDLVTTIVETNLSEQGNRMNLIMKKVTSWAAIIAVPTAVTGWYGQNLPYPGFGKQAGLIASSVLIVGLAVALFAVFRRKDWL